jgi:hypothetical protein
LVAPLGVYWEILAPGAVERSQTSSALPEKRLTMEWYPSAFSVSRHCWLVPLRSFHWTMSAPLAAFRPETSRT